MAERRVYGYLIGGLLPWSDAAGYYSGAQHLIYDGYLTEWATRRPLFSGFLAVLFSATSDNLQITLAILAMLNGLAVFFASRAIQKNHQLANNWIVFRCFGNGFPRSRNTRWIDKKSCL